MDRGGGVRLAELRSAAAPISQIREVPMLIRLGQFLQAIGFFMVPFAVVGNVVNPKEVSVGISLTFSGIGIAIFYLGRFLQRRGERR